MKNNGDASEPNNSPTLARQAKEQALEENIQHQDTSKATLFMALPEIRRLVCSFLHPWDLAACIPVNSTWCVLFTPHLYETLVFKFEDRTKISKFVQPTSGARKNVDHIRHFTAEHAYPLTHILPLERPNGANPDSSDEGGPGHQAKPDLTEDLDESNPASRYQYEFKITNLDISLPHKEYFNFAELLPKFIEVVSSTMPDLRHLKLGFRGFEIHRDEVFFVLYISHSHIETLDVELDLCDKLRCSRCTGDIPSALDLSRGSERPLCSVYPKLTKLRLSGLTRGSGYQTWIPLLQGGCSALRKLEIHFSKDKDFLDAFPETVAMHCPHLQTFCADELEPSVSDSYLARFLRIAGQDGWEDLDLSFLIDVGPLSIQAILSSHTATLVHLKLWSHAGITSRDIQQFFCTSPRLESFWILAREPATSPLVSLHAKDIDSSKWVCHNLKHLEVIIDGIDHNQKPESVRAEQEKVYKALASLKKLQVLSLASFEWSQDRAVGWTANYIAEQRQQDGLAFTIDSGIALLEGLKDIHTLDLRMLRESMAIKEVEWMSINWPRLRILRRCTFQDAPGAMDPLRVWAKENCPRIVCPYHVFSPLSNDTGQQ